LSESCGKERRFVEGTWFKLIEVDGKADAHVKTFVVQTIPKDGKKTETVRLNSSNFKVHKVSDHDYEDLDVEE
jgi:hypothetical protein